MEVLELGNPPDRNDENITWATDDHDSLVIPKESIMEIDGTQQEQLCEALLEAFPTRQDLERMVRYELNENLAVIAEGNNLGHTVFDLVQWSIARGRLEELVTGALRQNSQNVQLIRIVRQLELRTSQNFSPSFSTDKNTQNSTTYSSATPSVSQSSEAIPNEQKSQQSNAIIHFAEGKTSNPKGVEKQRLSILSTRVIRAILTIIPAIISILILSFLLVNLSPLTSIWCSHFICLAIQKTSINDLGEVSDQNLDASGSRQQSTSFELPGALDRYTLNNLPDNIAAVRSDGVQSSPYRLIIAVKNLHQTGYELYIDQVSLLVYRVPPLVNPLNVWNSASLTSNAVLYSVTYSGQPAGSELDATYESPVPSLSGLHQRLEPSETDYIALQVEPAHNLQADLLFHVSITYRMANEGQEATLTLPTPFEVVFSNANNWHVHNF